MDKAYDFALQLDKDLCTGCGVCAGGCTFGAIKMGDWPEVDPYACRLCGTCVSECPVGAWSIADEPKAETAADDGGIFVLAETAHGRIAPVTLELLGKARELAAKSGRTVEAIMAGNGVAALADELIAYGAERVHLLEADALSAYIEENYAKAVAGVVRSLRPDMLLVGATVKGRGLSARLASMLHTGLTADCTELDIDTETGLLRQIRPAFGGNLMATIVTPGHRPQMASVRPGVMNATERDAGRRGEIVRHDLSAFRPDARIILTGEAVKAVCGNTLADSRIVVGIGRGVKSRAAVDAITGWAKKVGAAVAGSRAAVECGLVDASQQVGQTGQTISPDLYIAIGISGQIQHTAAITGTKKIIAVNPDRNAPIFSVADYGWVATAEDALPVLNDISF